jgi:hypothetical protein
MKIGAHDKKRVTADGFYIMENLPKDRERNGGQ